MKKDGEGISGTTAVSKGMSGARVPCGQAEAGRRGQPGHVTGLVGPSHQAQGLSSLQRKMGHLRTGSGGELAPGDSCSGRALGLQGGKWVIRHCWARGQLGAATVSPEGAGRQPWVWRAPDESDRFGGSGLARLGHEAVRGQRGIKSDLEISEPESCGGNGTLVERTVMIIMLSTYYVPDETGCFSWGISFDTHSSPTRLGLSPYFINEECKTQRMLTNLPKVTQTRWCPQGMAPTWSGFGDCSPGHCAQWCPQDTGASHGTCHSPTGVYWL